MWKREKALMKTKRARQALRRKVQKVLRRKTRMNLLTMKTFRRNNYRKRKRAILWSK
jgi:hypothetical protein